MTDQKVHAPKRGRSPAYPSVNLESAVSYAATIYEREKRNAAPVSVVAQICGSNIKSSKGLRLIAALKQFGLVSEEGEGEDRHVRLTERALDIIVAKGNRLNADWRKGVAEAALSPKIHKALWDHYKGSLPSDESLRIYLVRQREFQEDAVRGFVKELRATLAFAGLGESATILDSNQQDNDDRDDTDNLTAGSYVQWTLQGVAQFSSPCKVLGVSDDGQFAFVEGVETGLPMAELTMQDCPSSPSSTSPHPAATTVAPTNPFFKPKQPEDEPPKAGVDRAVLPLDSGAVVLTWPDGLDKPAVEDIESWLKVVMRRVRRKAGMLPE